MLAVSFLCLGLRTGLVVALSIPLVLAMTFLLMCLFGIGLHKISLGALILSLGLLVDDAIIAVEMMAIKMEQGCDRFRAASFAYTSTAMPMLTGTLVTVAGFLPIATAQERHRRIHALDLRGVGDRAARRRGWSRCRDPVPRLQAAARPRAAAGSRRCRAAVRARLAGRPAPPPPATAPRDVDPDAVYDTPFYRRFRALVAWCVEHRRTVLSRRPSLVFVGVARAVPLRAAAVLPGVDAARADRRPAPRRRLVVRRVARGGEEARSLPRQEPGIENYVDATSATAARASTCRSTSSCSSRTSRSSSSWRRATRDREAVRTRLLALFDERIPEPARPRVAPGERPAGRLPGAVPRLRRGHAEGARDRAAGRRGDAREPDTRERAVRLGRADQGDPARRSTRTRRACSASARRSSPRSSTPRCRGSPSPTTASATS